MELGQLKTPADPVGYRYPPLPSNPSYYDNKVLAVFLWMPNYPQEAPPASLTGVVSNCSPGHTSATILGLLIPDRHF